MCPVHCAVVEAVTLTHKNIFEGWSAEDAAHVATARREDMHAQSASEAPLKVIVVAVEEVIAGKAGIERPDAQIA